MKKQHAGIIAIFAALIFLASCDGGPQQKDDAGPAIPEQAIEKFSITETTEGKPHWVLEASSAQILEQEKKVLLKAPRIQFFEDGKCVSTLVAARGRINTENYDIWGEGNCLLNTAKGERLETSNLYYKSDVKKIMTEDRVKLVRPNQIIYGKGMEATPDLEAIKIRKQRVEMRGNPSEGEGTTPSAGKKK
jgi:LPS export ABC transporter protein LptC